MEGVDERKRKIAKLLSLVIVISFFASLELVGRFLHKPSRLEKILSILDEDPDTIWYQRPRYHGDFFGTDITTDKWGMRLHNTDPSNKKVLVLGASPSFGWGVENNKTYSALLEKNLLGTQVINGSGVGFSSEQGLRLLKKHIDRIKPNIVTVSYVINDVDSYRFFQNSGTPDYQIGENSPVKVILGNLIRRSYFLSFLQTLISKIQQQNNPERFYFPGQTRVSRLRYEANLKSFIQLSKEKNFQLVFLKMPVNLKKGPEIGDENKGHLFYQRGIDSKAKELEKGKKCQSSLRLFKRAMSHHPLLSRAYYEYGDCLLLSGDTVKGQEFLKKVKEVESYNSSRRAISYNQLMESVANEYDIPLVDIVKAFSKEKEYLFLDPFSDTIHPNKKGHQIIAKEVLPVVSNILRNL